MRFQPWAPAYVDGLNAKQVSARMENNFEFMLHEKKMKIFLGWMSESQKMVCGFGEATAKR